MDLDDLLEVVESVGLARLVYEKIIITDIELAIDTTMVVPAAH